jgi:hypothetical protein
MVSANTSTSAGGLAKAVTGMRPMRMGAIQLMAARSRRTSEATCGRWTLTTTASPVTSVAACTWAMDAAARGSGAKGGEHFLEGPAEVYLHHLANGVEGLGGDAIAQ